MALEVVRSGRMSGQDVSIWLALIVWVGNEERCRSQWSYKRLLVRCRNHNILFLDIDLKGAITCLWTSGLEWPRLKQTLGFSNTLLSLKKISFVRGASFNNRSHGWNLKLILRLGSWWDYFYFWALVRRCFIKVMASWYVFASPSLSTRPHRGKRVKIKCWLQNVSEMQRSFFILLKSAAAYKSAVHGIIGLKQLVLWREERGRINLGSVS